MHLAIDALGTKRGGAATGFLEFLTVAVADPRIEKITVFSSPATDRLFAFPQSRKLRIIEKTMVDRNPFARIWWYEYSLSKACKDISADLLFIFANFGRGCSEIPHVTYVQQSLPFSREAIQTFDSRLERLRIMTYRHQMRRSCQDAARVICQSSVMQDYLVRCFDIHASKIEVVYVSPRKLDKIPGDYRRLDPMRAAPAGSRILYVGDSYPYKMVETATMGTRLLRQYRPQVQLFLTLPEDHPFSHEHGVTCLSYLEAGELREAFELADLLVLPSLVESCGLPPLEAMSLGTPVLIADRPYARDIFEDAAVFFDPMDAEDLAKQALRILEDEALQGILIQKGLNLVQKRNAGKPYQRILDICVEEFARSATKVS
ncbi:glycosyltransferase [Desulfomonile tiedjei]|uniref:Glycosyltransferase n=1 Tax=Desulfomonile tiedjei (strain ATCC 49306 / DSM 6799 / DCB-1) TaxID=706587 RepID=I4C254_DESTA|nr:glycosyltransferase [Desulfomonile tiedjei]AFM23645.1 glycosyltransferase [Desulfomonile tiedjei DSM 6799]